ncbi:MAG: hypothetical protein AAF587_44435 [Bacteroidota bacterium]
MDSFDPLAMFLSAAIRSKRVSEIAPIQVQFPISSNADPRRLLTKDETSSAKLQNTANRSYAPPPTTIRTPASIRENTSGAFMPHASTHAPATLFNQKPSYDGTGKSMISRNKKPSYDGTGKSMISRNKKPFYEGTGKPIVSRDEKPFYEGTENPIVSRDEKPFYEGTGKSMISRDEKPFCEGNGKSAISRDKTQCPDHSGRIPFANLATTLASPSPPSSGGLRAFVGNIPSATHTAQRTLFNIAHASGKGTPNPGPKLSKEDKERFESVATCTIANPTARKLCPKNFQSLCRFLALPAANDTVLARMPSEPYRQHVLVPLSASKITSIDEFGEWVTFYWRMTQAIQGTDFLPYNTTWFSYQRAHSIHSFSRWQVASDIPDPSTVPPGAFHPYQLVAALPEFSTHSCQLPTDGLSAAQAMALAQFVMTLFSCMDVKGNNFEKQRFPHSVLGQRLMQWRNVLQNPSLVSHWSAHPRSVTFHWFENLRSLLHIFHQWNMTWMYNDSGGFIIPHQVDDMPDSTPSLPLEQAFYRFNSSTTYCSELKEWDRTFQRMWQKSNINPEHWVAGIEHS